MKPDAGWMWEDGYINKTFLHKDNLYLVEKGNKKLASLIKRKLNTIKNFFCKINTNEKKDKVDVLKINVTPQVASQSVVPSETQYTLDVIKAL